MERLNVIAKHLSVAENYQNVSIQKCAAKSFPNNPDDIVVVEAVRTPIGKSRRGFFKDTYGDELLAATFKGLLDKTKVQAADVGDVCVGNVNDGKSAFTARVAQFFSDFPDTVPVSSVNRQCGSGLQAFMNIAGGIKNKTYNIGIASGVESMTKDAMGGKINDLNPKIMDNELARNSLIPMGITSENVATRFGITREEQDKFAMESHLKAAKATREGLFKAEIIPVSVKVIDKEGQEKTVTVSQDEGIRPNTTMEGLAKLKPAFQAGGSTTAGNSSQTSDGAAAVLVASRAEAERRGLPILGTLRGFAVKGCAPDIMGVGPAVAIPEVLQMTGLTIGDIDIYEINEAFASQAYYCVKKLGIPAEKVNPKGGAIAFGHPLGATGARMIATLLHEMKRRGKKGLGVVSMCMGTGMGAAAIFEYSP